LDAITIIETFLSCHDAQGIKVSSNIRSAREH
jgi:hypothetical protein